MSSGAWHLSFPTGIFPFSCATSPNSRSFPSTGFRSFFMYFSARFPFLPAVLLLGRNFSDAQVPFFPPASFPSQPQLFWCLVSFPSRLIFFSARFPIPPAVLLLGRNFSGAQVPFFPPASFLSQPQLFWCLVSFPSRLIFFSVWFPFHRTGLYPCYYRQHRSPRVQ